MKLKPTKRKKRTQKIKNLKMIAQPMMTTQKTRRKTTMLMKRSLKISLKSKKSRS